MLISNRATNILLVAVLAVGIAIVAMLASGARGGPLDPPGAPGSTLPQVEPRIPISQPASGAGFPIIISDPGSYFLTGNIAAPAGKDGIIIAAQRVTLDLNGFVLAGQPSQKGISDDNIDVRADLLIRNGAISGWEDGIWAPFFVRSTFEDLRITGHPGGNVQGIHVGSGNTVRRVTATENGGAGLVIVQQGSYYAGAVTDSNLSGNGTGLTIDANNITVRHNVIDGNATGVSIFNSLSWLEDNDITGNTGYGVVLFGPASSSLNTVVRNFMPFNSSGPVNDLGAGDRIGAITSTASSNDVWSNIAY